MAISVSMLLERRKGQKERMVEVAGVEPDLVLRFSAFVVI